jgi:hypothetical protein
MKAKFSKPQNNAVNHSGKKELIDSINIIGKLNGQLRTIVTARFYMGKSASASVVYCSLWVNAGENSTSGKGSAGGYGYHKESQALQYAIESAGISLWGSAYSDENGLLPCWVNNPEFNLEYAATLSDSDFIEYQRKTPKLIYKKTKENLKKSADIGGVGHSAMLSALLAIAKAAGGKGKLLVVEN